MSRFTHERTPDETDLEVLDPRWPEPDSPSNSDATDKSATPEHHVAKPRRASPTRRPKTRRLRVAGLVIAAAVAGAATAHEFDARTRTYTPPWTVACQDAIDATAHLHRLRVTQLAQGMEEAFALIGGADIPKPNAIDASVILNARRQRDVDNAIGRCISPASPHA